jgi:hypothetical protein
MLARLAIDLLHKFSEGLDCNLDRNVGIRAVLVAEIDVVGLKSSKRRFKRFSDKFGIASDRVLGSEAKLCCQKYLFSLSGPSEPFTHQFFTIPLLAKSMDVNRSLSQARINDEVLT